jgi:hypothetical protein
MEISVQPGRTVTSFGFLTDEAGVVNPLQHILSEQQHDLGVSREGACLDIALPVPERISEWICL